MDEVKALKAWLKVRPDDGSPFLFNSQTGGRLSQSQVFRIFQQCAKDAGLSDDRRFVHILQAFPREPPDWEDGRGAGEADSGPQGFKQHHGVRQGSRRRCS